MLSRLFAKPDEERTIASTAWGSWGDDTGGTWSGTKVTPESSLQLLTVYGCVRMIVDAISTMPVDVFRKDSSGNKLEVDRPPWLANPTPALRWTQWSGQVLTSLLLHGNAYVLVQRSGSKIVELPVLDPMSVMVRRNGGRKEFVVNGQVLPAEIMHLSGLMLPGSDVGLSPVEYARQSIGLGLSAVEFGSRFFDSEGNMPGVIEIPTKAQPEYMQAMARSWRRNRSRSNRGMPGVLSEGATWKPTGVTNEQAQFLATRQFTASEIAGQMFLLDPSDLGIAVTGTSLTYSNLEQRNARRLQVTFLPWIIRIEQAVSALLAQPGFIKLNVDSLLRGDSAARWATYEAAARINLAAAQIGQPPVLLTAEMREFEDLDMVDAALSASPSLSVSEQALMLQKLYLSVGVILTTDEARDMARIAGVDLPADYSPDELGQRPIKP